MDAVGTTDGDFLQGLISSLTEANTIDNQFDKRGFDSMLSVVKGLKPRDQVEAMLGAQMAAVHSASMRFAGRLASALNIPEMETAYRALTKLTRTFAGQIDTLKRYRSDGPNTVQNVSVSDGGQAVVANNITHLAKETARSEAVASGLGSAKANGREQ